VQAGDIVLHYNDGYVRAVSHVLAAAVHAPYPYETDPEYGGMQGYLVRRQYHLLEPPIPRDILAGLKTLPEQDHPFTSTGSVKQGYLYRFGLDALSELVPRFETNWPSFVRDNVLDHPSHGASYDHPGLRRFVDEIVNMTLGVTEGKRVRYTPIMLLAATRT